MYKKFSETIFASQGILVEDAVEKYQNISNITDCSSDVMEIGITKVLEQLLSKNATFDMVPRGVWNGNQERAHVARVQNNSDVYYLKLSQQENPHFGMILAEAFHNSFKIEDVKVAKIHSHGTILLKEGNFFYTLIEEAKGLQAYDLFMEKNDALLLKLSKFLGKKLASIHSKYITKATSYDKYLISTTDANQLSKKIFYSKTLKQSAIQNLYFIEFAKKISPLILSAQQKYLLSNQYKTLSTTLTKIKNLSYEPKMNQITVFDTTSYTKYCNRNQQPMWAPEESFALFFRYFDLAKSHLDLDSELINQCKEEYIKSYAKNNPSSVMTLEGIQLYMLLGQGHVIKRLILEGDKNPNLYIQASQKIYEFKEFHKSVDTLINKHLKI